MNNIERLMTLNEAQKFIRKEYQRDITSSTLRNWIKRGLVSNSGHRYILEARLRSGIFRGWWTSIRAINTFIAELDQ